LVGEVGVVVFPPQLANPTVVTSAKIGHSRAIGCILQCSMLNAQMLNREGADAECSRVNPELPMIDRQYQHRAFTIEHCTTMRR
jgi:hypothetical protein